MTSTFHHASTRLSCSPPCAAQVENIPAFIAGVKNKKEKMFGFGHRVYRNFDPRAKIIKEVRHAFNTGKH